MNNMNKKPLVSVLVPNYNYGRFLENCLESVYKQTYSNIEVIFYDNNSTDNSYEIAIDYQKKFREKNIFMHVARNRRNMGSGHNCSKCLRESEGKYMFWLSSDDAIKPTYIEKCVKILEENQNVGFTMSHRIEIDEQGNLYNSIPFYNCSCIIPGEDQAAVFMMAGIAVPSQLLIRKSTYSVMLQSKPINPQVAGDWLDNFMLSCFGDVAYINEPLVEYRVHKSNETTESERNLVGIMEHFLIVNAFKWISESFEMTKPASRYQEAIEKLGSMCLRYATKMLKANEQEGARKYLQLAPVFKKEIISEDKYIELCEILKMNRKEQEEKLADLSDLNRKISYDPPKDSKKIYL